MNLSIQLILMSLTISQIVNGISLGEIIALFYAVKIVQCYRRKKATRDGWEGILRRHF